MKVSADAGRHWQVIALVAGAVAAATAALWPAVASLAGDWLAIHDYRHGFVIAPVAIAWLFAVVYRVRLLPIRISPTGSALLAGALFAWLVALRANSDIAIEALFPPVVWLTILAAAGWPLAREAIAPVAYLYFAIPVWEFLLPTLQWLSVSVVESALALTGVPAEVREYHVALPAGSFAIIEGCSGKRYFIVALAISVIAGVFQQSRGWRMAALVAAGGLLALVANWIRIFVVIVVGHATDMQHYLVAVEHQTFGNVIFVALLAAIYCCARWIAPSGPTGSDRSGSRAALPPQHNAPVARTVAAPFLLLGMTAILAQAPAEALSTTPQALGPLPFVADRWQGPLPGSALWSPRFIEPDAERRASYRDEDGRSIEVYLNFYRTQRAGKELVYYQNSLLAPGSWSRSWPQRMALLDTAREPPLATLEARSPDGQRWLVAYVYKVGGWTTVRGPLVQTAYGLQSLMGPVPSGTVSLTVQCAENCQDARALVRVFWQEMSGSLLGMIPDDAT